MNIIPFNVSQTIWDNSKERFSTILVEFSSFVYINELMLYCKKCWCCNVLLNVRPAQTRDTK